MSFNIAKMLLGCTNECNGHLSTVIKGLSIEDGLEIIKDLNEYVNHESNFVLQVWADGGYAVYELDYWKREEHILGHTDRLILNVEIE